jgi:hypothetical protein
MTAVTQNIQLRVCLISLLFVSLTAYGVRITFVKLPLLLTECRAITYIRKTARSWPPVAQTHKNVVTTGNSGWSKVEMQKNIGQCRKTPSHICMVEF